MRTIFSTYLVFAITYLSGAQISFRNLNVINGLSQNSVVSIQQDTFGFLWLATQDGLCSYDGEFKVYPCSFDDLTFPNSKTLGLLYIDKRNNLFAIAEEGALLKLNRLEGLLEPIDDLKNISYIIQDDSFFYWLITRDNYLIKWNEEFVEQGRISLPFDKIHAIELVGEEVMLLTDDGVFVVNDSLDYLSLYEVIAEIPVSSIVSVGEGRYILGTMGKGVFEFSRIDNSLSPIHSIPDNIVTYDIVLSSDKKVWIATYGDGLFVYDTVNNNSKHFIPNKENSNSISYHDILDLYEDRDGTMWLGTDGSGVDYFDPKLSKFGVATNDILGADVSIDVIRAISSHDSNVYLGTSGKGLTVYQKNLDDYYTLTEKDGLSSNRIMSVYHDGKNLLVGTQEGGLNVLESYKSKYNVVQNALEQSTIWTILSALEPELFWLGTRNDGLILWHKEEGIVDQIMLKNNFGETLNIRDIAYNGGDALWLATDYDGIWIYDIGDNKAFRESAGPANIKCITTYNNEVYAGSNGTGIWRYDTSHGWTQFLTIEEGLPNNVIYGIEFSSDSTFWISTNRGISKIGLENHGITIKNYSHEDGLQYYEFNTGAYYQDDEGVIYFGGIKGYNWFDPNNMPKNDKVPQPIIKRVVVNNSIDVGLSDIIRLKPEQRNFEITFSSMQLTLPKRSNFQYRLLGYSNEWTSTSSTQASFMNMQSGDYTFQLKASNYDDIWSEEVIEQKIKIEEYWYLTFWFKFLVGSALSYLGFLIWNSKRKQAIAETELFKNELKSKYLSDINLFQSNTVKRIAQDIRSPLSVMNGLITNSSIQPEEKERLLHNSQGLLNMSTQLLDLAKIKGGDLGERNETFEVLSLFEDVILSFQPYASRLSITLQLFSIHDELMISQNKNKVKMVLSNLIINALSNATKYGKILVLLSKTKENKMVLEVQDNGRKIDKIGGKDISQWIIEEENIPNSKSLGLLLAKELIRSIKGSINIDYVEIGNSVKVEIGQVNETSYDVPKNSKQHIIYEQLKLEQKLTVLIIEDNADLCEYLKGLLEDEYVVQTAKNGLVGTQKAEEDIPDIIITDIMMPNLDGYGVIEHVRSKIETSHIPIIVLTAKHEQEDKLQVIYKGADAYLNKPFDEQELKIRIASLLENRKRAQQFFSLTQRLDQSRIREESFMDKVKACIHEHLQDEKFGVPDICRAVHLERTQVYRKIKALTGMSPSALIRTVRMEHSWHLLKEGSMQVNEVAYACGFKEASYFSKVFKDHFNCLPSDIVG